MLNMEKIIYIGNFSFPLGNAAGKRVYGNGKLLRDIGYEVIYVGLDANISRSSKLIETRSIYDGFEFYNFPYPSSYCSWLNYHKRFEEFKSFIFDRFILKEIKMIIYYGSPSISLFISKLIRFSKANRIILISDCVDWLSYKTNNLLFDLVKWFDNYYQKAYLNKRVNGLIVISKYLQNYYARYGLISIIIPPLSTLDSNNSVTIPDTLKTKEIVYAGLPFRKNIQVRNLKNLKDRIDKMIILLYHSNKMGANFTLNLYGFTKEELLSAIPILKPYVDELGDCIKFYGQKSNLLVTEKIAQSDFVMLIRDVNRSTSAGFPTKISESIVCGTPVITNRTSDIDSYIIENKNGFFIENEINDSSIRTIVEILNLDIRVIKREIGNYNPFSYSRYYLKVQNFINDLYRKKGE